MRRWLVAFVIVVTPCRIDAQSTIRTIELPEPWGPFAPAVASHLVIDSTRRDAHSDGFRKIQLRIWYPSDVSAGVKRPYMPRAVADAWRSTIPVPEGFEAGVVSHSLENALPSADKQRWPVLLFSHGRSFPVENYHLALEHMASMGWVVAAISHPYEEALTLLPDGSRLPFRGPRWKQESERGDVLMSVVDQLVGDASRVIDYLAQLNEAPAGQFADRLDLAAGVGYFGHSLGGAAAVWTQQRDPRVVAAASWEGQVYRVEDQPLRVSGPLLYIVAGTNRSELVGTQFRPAPKGGPVFELVLRGASHASFGDMLHIYGAYADRAWHERHRREIEPLRANQITGDYLHEFFNYALLGGELDLLWPDSERELASYRTWNYPEIELRVYSARPAQR